MEQVFDENNVVHFRIVKDGSNFTSLKNGDLRPYNASLREM